MRLRETLIIYMFPLLVIPTLAFGYLAYKYIETSNAQRADAQLSNKMNPHQQKLKEFMQAGQQSQQ